ncbi:signal-regulatory protein beta-2-like [Perca flavescens]|uniref:signal-regulatory protein beta-2-like n=1 Tax=Perca flavescens TaxID=8167 RepID=UPI00106EC330|nr:signal-regulatory protein beta-2-like [Perca flavescens]
MILLWVTLLVLHQGYSLVPVRTVQLGEPATFTCALHYKKIGRPQLNWYKQSAGESLKLIVTKRESTKPEYAPEFSESRLEIKNDNNFSNLTILRTIQEDEGMYHCASTELYTSPVWSGTYLLIKGNTQKTSNYTVVQWPTASDPVRPGDSVTLQCSVLSDSGNKRCPGDDRVFWVRAGLNKSYPDIIYTDGGRHNECDKRSDTQKSCVYRFSKNVSSSDDGTYYCAVATCGEILFGDGTKLPIEQTPPSVEFIALVIATVCLVISMTGNIVFFCYRTSTPVCSQFKGIENASSQARHDNSRQSVQDIPEDGLDLNYAALHFSGKKTTRGRKKTELRTEESVYSQVKC